MTVLVGASAFVACGGDDTSTPSVAVAVAETSEPTVTSPIASSGTSSITTPDTSPEAQALLIDALPELAGPTVLWFWAPG